MRDFWIGFNEATAEISVIAKSCVELALEFFATAAIIAVFVALFFGLSLIHWRLLHARTPVWLIMFVLVKWIVVVPVWACFAVCMMNGVMRDFTVSGCIIGALTAIYIIVSLVHFFWQKPWEDASTVSKGHIVRDWSNHLDVCFREVLS